MRHLVGYFLVSSALVGCSLSTVGSMEPVDGGKCDKPMETKTAEDGCTVCTCDGTTWSCTSDECTTGCKEGEKKVADDKCNACTCGADGKWDCTTDLKCGEGCTAGDKTVSTDGCTTCLCAEDGAWDCSHDDNCNSMVECKAGETKPGDGGCYDCTCDASGHWACPDIACEGCKEGEESHNDCFDCVCNAMGTWSCSGFFDGNCGGGEVCKAGETRPADDGCNKCVCDEAGQWACTLLDCGPTCPNPRMAPAEGCDLHTVWAQDPATATCCKYASSCEAPPMWKTFETPGECEGMGTVCKDYTGDCDGDPANGCEADLSSSVDNCGTCGQTCLGPDGQMGKCSIGKCEFPGDPSKICTYQGVTFSVGASFTARDGCNQCGCIDATGAGAVVACTDLACKCDPEAETYRSYVESDPDECALIDFPCPANTSVFGNECGCGCEQSDECPPVWVCSDPTDGTCDSMREQCPYTMIYKL